MGQSVTKPVIENNKVGRTLAGSGNSPAPIDESKPNTVKGSRAGQCSAVG